MTAPAPLVAGRWDWDGVCQDDGTGDWTAGNDHGRRYDRLNSQRRTPEDRNVIKTPGQPALLRPSPPHRPKYYSLHRPTGGVPLLTATAATVVAITVTVTLAAQRSALSGGWHIHGDCL